MGKAVVLTVLHDEAKSLLEGRVDELHGMAYMIVERHWAFVRQMENKLPGWENKSCLQVRCMKEGNSIRLDWCGLKWYGAKAKGNRRSVRLHISKPAGAYGYTLSKLMAFAREWEKPLVQETESSLMEIRREASHLVKALAALRNARQAALRIGSPQESRDGE